MKVEHWLVPGTWCALLLSLGILLFVNMQNNAGKDGNNFSLYGGELTSLTVITDQQQRIKLTLRKPFTAGEQNFLRAVAAYSGKTVAQADAYQLHLPAAACEFSFGLLMYCDIKNIPPDAVDKAYSLSWWRGEQLLLQLTPQQLAPEGLILDFRTSREKKSVLNAAGDMRNNCILQAHLQIGVFKNPQQNARLSIEDVFFILSEKACVV